MQATKAQQRRRLYPTDIKDKEWARIEHLVPQTKAGCTWRMLPHDPPPWEVVLVYMHSAQWRDQGVFERINLSRLERPGATHLELPEDVLGSPPGE